MLSKMAEVYIDDILVKRRKYEDHYADLQQVFDPLQYFGMKLNPIKCAFGVSTNKFFGFLVIEQGIEVDPTQINAIQELKSPQSKKDV